MVSMRFHRKAGMTKLKVLLKYQGQNIDSKVIPLPPEPDFNLRIDSADFRANGFTIVVANDSAQPAPDVSLVCVKAPANNPNNWSIVINMFWNSVPGNGSQTFNSNRPVGWEEGCELFKVTVKRGSKVYDEQIFDTR